MLIGRGKIRYFDDEWKVNVRIEDDLARYYRSLLPKYWTVNQQKYPPHITVVRREKIPNKQFWRKYEGKEIEFGHSSVKKGTVYYWLEAYSDFLCELRVELGLPPHNDLTKPPDKKSCFHMTIGNMK